MKLKNTIQREDEAVILDEWIIYLFNKINKIWLDVGRNNILNKITI